MGKADSPLGFRLSPCLRSDDPKTETMTMTTGACMVRAGAHHPPEPTAFKVETDGSMGERHLPRTTLT